MNNRLRHTLLAIIATFTLLVSQAAALQHSHEGDLQPRFDCQMCLKLGSSGAIPAAGLSFGQPVSLTFYLEPPISLADAAAPVATARAPPARLA